VKQDIQNGTRVVIHRPGRAWHGFSGEVTGFYPENPFGVCYVVSLDNGMRAGAAKSELRTPDAGEKGGADG
jgi:hypothetical protein